MNTDMTGKVPETRLVDLISGYAIDLPVTEQGYPGWWNVEPDVYARIKKMRVKYEVTVDDFPEEWQRDYKPTPPGKRMTMRETLDQMMEDGEVDAD